MEAYLRNNKHFKYWQVKPIKNLLLDINGVLFESGEEYPIEGSVEAMKELVDRCLGFCLVTNECTLPKRLLAKKLNDFGFDMITPDKIVSPAPTACEYIMNKGLRPRLHVWDGVKEEFQPAIEAVGKSDAASGTKQPENCIVIGDVMGQLSRDFVDESLEVMLNSPQTPQIITLGAGRYYKDSGKYRMDTGAYAKAFAYALGVDEITCVGKPSTEFFQQALSAIKPPNGLEDATVENTAMIGDDIVSDVGGAQSMGMRGFLVKTGKYKPSDETDRGVTADEVFENLLQAVNHIADNESLRLRISTEALVH